MIAYIPARGGSKRILRKNLRSLGGRPIILHTIATVKKLPFISQVYVSTDDSEIAGCVEAEGAMTLELRTTELSSDTATLVDLIRHDLSRFLRHAGTSSTDRTALIALPTAALLSEELLLHAYDTFKQSQRPLLCATTSYSASPFRALIRSEASSWRPLHPDMLMVRSQDLPETCVDTGMFYFMNHEEVCRHPGHWFTIPGGIECYPVPANMACDVDTPDDWAKLEQLYEALRGAPKPL
jgi:pseudaminic acid cytidylyltransferase